MAFNKSLELAKIKPSQSFLGDYTLVGNQWFRDFNVGATIYSRDGKTKYLVGQDGSFRRL